MAGKSRRGKWVAAVVVVAGIFGVSWLVAGDDGHSKEVSRETVSPWPFTVESGTLRCRPGQAVTFEAGGTEYGLNGAAQVRYVKPQSIWADDPTLGNGLKVNLSSVVKTGLALC
ncbi:DUF2511 domain-containing protein [Kitasatospora sp. NPDC048194]|uniref:DUF2511 domain-containing protein n=1 Tax=Kitasatospora sp. NPDC048194 TaxID=3364045 RepID=UPI003720F985